MSISASIPAIGSLSAEALGLQRADFAALNGVTGALFTGLNQQPPPLPVLPSSNGLAIHTSKTADTNAANAGVDPLTPRGLTVNGSAALAQVITTVTLALANVQGNTPAQFTQLLQSPGFHVLLQVLGPGESGPSSSLPLTTLLPAENASTSSASPATTTAAATSTANSPSPSIATATGAKGTTNESPYFQKLLGELENAYKASTGTAPSPALHSSELDLFLKWLSLNGASSVVANA